MPTKVPVARPLPIQAVMQHLPLFYLKGYVLDQWLVTYSYK